ncbi:hypothetical protein [Cerasicoccus frondis]|uniref:hypothetical protein n=1 Tax=Cerasicoccus frondis TaxID=490090 RepID=UPI0028526B25|nr:hypothetical protein [Cerasicoccus frondis]
MRINSYILLPIIASYLLSAFCFGQENSQNAINQLHSLSGNADALASSEEAAVFSGTLLPQEFIDERDSPGLSKYAAEDQGELVMLFVNQLKAGDPGKVPEMLISESRILPPRERDIAIANAVIGYQSVALELHSHDKEQFPLTTISDWEPLFNSPNPIYRFLALNAITRSCPADYQSMEANQVTYKAAQERYEALQNFFDESDDYLQLCLVTELSKVPLQESLDYIKNRQSQYMQADNAYMAKQIGYTIDNLENLIKSAPKTQDIEPATNNSLPKSKREPSLQISSDTNNAPSLREENRDSQHIHGYYIIILITFAILLILILFLVYRNRSRK